MALPSTTGSAERANKHSMAARECPPAVRATEHSLPTSSYATLSRVLRTRNELALARSPRTSYPGRGTQSPMPGCPNGLADRFHNPRNRPSPPGHHTYRRTISRLFAGPTSNKNRARSVVWAQSSAKFAGDVSPPRAPAVAPLSSLSSSFCSPASSAYSLLSPPLPLADSPAA